MLNTIKNLLSRFKHKAKSQVQKSKEIIDDSSQRFTESFCETKTKPKSKRKAFLFGFRF